MEKQILFNTRMVKALLEGRKTVTRRDPFQTPENYSRIKGMYRDDKNRLCVLFHCTDPEGPVIQDIHARYQPGDILWVRETWAAWSPTYGTAPRLIYKADDNAPAGVKWRPSIHMPKKAARIFLRVTGVRVERLQDISGEDIRAEGVLGKHFRAPTRGAFADVWNHTLKRKDLPLYGWESNPWVWVIKFERIDREDTTC